MYPVYRGKKKKEIGSEMKKSRKAKEMKKLEYWTVRFMAKKDVAKVRPYCELYMRLDTEEGEED